MRRRARAPRWIGIDLPGEPTVGEAHISLRGFEILERVGQGGMAVVWKARQLSLDRIVALKQLLPEFARRPDEVRRLFEEARVAAKLKHPCLVQVYDACEQDGTCFFVMEYVAGYSVGEWIRRKGRIGEADALAVAESVAQALEYAWRTARLIHCDIKPDNIMVDQDGTIKVADLGISRVGETKGMEEGVEEICGTPSYMSPEQCEGAQDLDQRSDIYSLGATLYHMLTGRRMFQDRSDAEALEGQVKAQVPDVMEAAPGVSLGMACLLERMLAKDRTARPADWHAVIVDVQQVRSGHLPLEAPLPEGASTMARCRRRAALMRRLQPGRTAKRIMATVVALLAAIAAAWQVWERWGRHADGAAPIASSEMKGAAGLPTAATQGQPPPEPAGTEPEALVSSDASIRAQIDEIRRRLDGAAEEHDRAVEALESLMTRLRAEQAPPALLEAADRLKEAADRKRQAALAELNDEVERLTERGEWAAAATRLETYQGPGADDSAADRKTRAAALRERSEESSQREGQNRAWESALRKAAAMALDGDLAAARNALSAAQDASGETAEDLKAVLKLIEGASHPDDRIMEVFLALTNRMVRVQRVQGPPLNLIIRRVEGRKLCGQIPDASAEIWLDVADLSPGDKLARLMDSPAPEAALAAGLTLARMGRTDQAAKLFEQAGTMLAGALQEEMARRSSKDLDEKARTALEELARMARVETMSADLREWVRAASLAEMDAATAREIKAAVARYRKTYSHSRFAEEAELVLQALEAAAGRIASLAPNSAHVQLQGDGADGEATVAERLVEALCAENPGLTPSDVWGEATPDGRVHALTIQSAVIGKLTPLAKAATLKRLHISVPGRDPARIDLSHLAGLDLRHLHLSNCSIRNLAAARQFPSLTHFSLNGCTADDWNALQGLKLEMLSLEGSDVRDASLLAPVSARELNVGRTALRDLSVLRGKDLAKLQLDGLKVTDFTFLAGMKLREFSARQTAFRDLNVLRDMPLEGLYLAGCKTHDFQMLRRMPLRRADLSDTQFKDLSVLAGKPMTSLNLARTPVVDLSPLRGMPLEHLDLNGTAVRDISVLAGMPLKTLDLSGTKVSFDSVKVLKGMAIEKLSLAHIPVRDISVLEGMPLWHLDIENTQVSDVRPLKGMPLRVLLMRGAPVRDLTPLLGMGIRQLTITGEPEQHAQALRTMRSLQSCNGMTWWPGR